MTIETAALTRQFTYNGAKLVDPGAALSVDQVRAFYTAVYPDLANAEVEGPEEKDGVQLYTFRRAVGTKGADFVEVKPVPEPGREWTPDSYPGPGIYRTNDGRFFIVGRTLPGAPMTVVGGALMPDVATQIVSRGARGASAAGGADHGVDVHRLFDQLIELKR